MNLDVKLKHEFSAKGQESDVSFWASSFCLWEMYLIFKLLWYVVLQAVDFLQSP